MLNCNDVYLHRKADTGEVFYVGIGAKGRATSRSGRTAHWKNIVAKHGLRIEYVARGITRADAVDAEVFLIEWLGRQATSTGPLINITDGGEGCPGRDKGKKLSAEHRAKLAAAKLGTKQKPETVAKRLAKTRGQKRSPEVRAMFSEMAKNRSKEHLAKISAANTGKKQSPEARKKMSKSRLGKPNKKLCKPVMCFETGQVFESLKAASDWAIQSGLTHSVRGSKSLISAACLGREPTAYGYRWAYANKPLAP